MRSIIQSFFHACNGLIHALSHERSVRLYCIGYGVVIAVGAMFGVTRVEWMVLMLCGGLFAASELLNTALERLVDAVDVHAKEALGHAHYTALKATKDVAASASLVVLIVTVAVVLIVFWPYVTLL